MRYFHLIRTIRFSLFSFTLFLLNKKEENRNNHLILKNCVHYFFSLKNLLFQNYHYSINKERLLEINIAF
jgi:hypothetical protein